MAAAAATVAAATATVVPVAERDSAALAAGAGSSIRSLRVGTLNVHGFCDDRGDIPELIKLVKRANLDIVGLQEVGHRDDAPGGSLPKLASGTGMPHIAACLPTFLGNAIIARIPATAKRTVVMSAAGDHQRCGLTVDAVAPSGHAFRFGTLHLNHTKEPIRLRQWADALPVMLRRDDATMPTVLVGDFNSLTRADYTDAEWDTVAAVRARGRWEEPQVDLTAAVRAAGFVDMYTAARAASPPCFKGALSTCAYNTRIDYVWASPAFAAAWRLVRYEHVATRATDHSLVVAEFVPIDATPGGSGSGAGAGGGGGSAAGGGTDAPPATGHDKTD